MLIRVRHACCLVIPLAVLSLACPVLAQEPISQKIWDDYHRIARQTFQTTPYRTKTTVEDRKTEQDAWRLYSESVAEYVYPNRRYFKGKYLETITVGKLIYIKRSNGGWLVKDLSKEKSVATVESVERISDDFSREPESETQLTKFNDGNSTVLTWETKVKMKFIRNERIFEIRSIRRAWFDENGQFEKTEVESYEPYRQIFLRTTEVFEYDESIRIEVPIQ